MLIIITVEKKKVKPIPLFPRHSCFGLLATSSNVQVFLCFLYNRDGKTSPKEKRERKSLTSPLDTQQIIFGFIS